MIATPSAIRLGDRGQRAVLALAQGNDNAALSHLLTSTATVNAILNLVRRPDMTAAVRAVDLNYTVKGDVFVALSHGLAEFVREDEGRLVLAIQVTRELAGRHALDRIHEQGRARPCPVDSPKSLNLEPLRWLACWNSTGLPNGLPLRGALFKSKAVPVQAPGFFFFRPASRASMPPALITLP